MRRRERGGETLFGKRENMRVVLDFLIGIAAVAFAVLSVTFPARARRRNLDVDEAYPGLQLLYPVLLVLISLQQFVDYPGARNRYVDGFLFACCIFFVAFPLLIATRRRKLHVWSRYRITASVLYGAAAVGFAVLTVRP